MNVLLTGGLGYIGSHTALVLLELGHKLVLFDNLSNSSVDVLKKIEKITGKDVLFVEGDVRDTELLKSTIESQHIDSVLHFAGLKAVGESVKDPLNYYENNVQGTISLIQAMHAQNIRILVFSSSATVYGKPDYLPFDEVHPTNAVNPYGRTKLHVEEMLHDVALSHAGWCVACLRYFNPIGAHESGLIGEKPLGTPNNLMPHIAKVATGEMKELQIFGNDYPTPDGTGIRDYIHVMDLAEGHAKTLSYLSDGRYGWHAINLGTGEGHSVLEIVKTFEKVSGRAIPYKVASRREGDIASYYADPSKAHQLLGWIAQRTLEDSCASAWQFQRMISAEAQKNSRDFL